MAALRFSLAAQIELYWHSRLAGLNGQPSTSPKE